MTATVDRVVDASVIAAVAFQESRGPEAESLIDGAALFALVLMAYELANVARTKTRRHPAHRGLILERQSDALAIPIQWIDVGHLQVVELALQTGLSTYDASYLYVARSIGAGLVTFDQRLEAAARSL